MITTPGIQREITPAQYFGEPCPAPACTNSAIRAILNTTPADCAYNHPALTPNRELIKSTIEQRLGDVTHQLALGKGRGYRIGDFERWDKRIPQVADFLARCEMDGVTPVKEKEFAPLQAMAEILKSRIQAILDAEAIRRGLPTPVEYETEVVFAWIEETEFGPVWCRGMMDVFCEPLMMALDPKITKRLYDDRIDGHMKAMGWDNQNAWYTRGLNAIFPEHAGRISFGDLMVSPNPPHVFRHVGLDKARRLLADADCERGLQLFAKCLHSKSWPGFQTARDDRAPTSWMLKQAMDAAIQSDEDEDEGEDEA